VENVMLSLSLCEGWAVGIHNWQYAANEHSPNKHMYVYAEQVSMHPAKKKKKIALKKQQQ
jgi:hypothetical protein